MRLFRSAIPLLIAAATMALPSPSNAQIAVGVSVRIAPPPLPIYVQPPIPGPGYIWTPGYWAWGDEGYYWVPGTWVEPPVVGVLWTPGYWGWSGGTYVWHAGYWGPHIGFYGGVNYGFGYVGVGYEGGYWQNGVFSYNRTVNNFGSTTITNVYSKTVINNTTVTNVSYNGGAGGTTAQPTSQEQAAAHEQHVAATATQTDHQQAASTNRALLASVNHGKPAVAATAKPGEFSGHHVVGAKDLKGPNGTSTNANQSAGPHPPDAHKLSVTGGANTAHPTALGTPLKPSATPTVTRGTEPNTVHPPATTMPHTLDAPKGSGPGGPNQSHPVGAAKLSATPPPKPPGPHPVVAAPHPSTPHPVAHGGSPPNKKKPNG